MRFHHFTPKQDPAKAIHRLGDRSAYLLPSSAPGASSLSHALGEKIAESLTGHCGKDIAQEVARQGIERLHRLVDAESILKVSAEVNHWARELAPRLLDDFLLKAVRYDRPAYLSTFAVVRFYLPYSCFVRERERFAGDDYFELTTHNPHLDSWYAFPSDTVNVLVALSRMTAKNGMTFFPDADRLAVRPANPERPPRDWRLGKGIPYTCEAGDTILFLGDVPHGTVLNRSDETRVSATFRFFRSEPPRGGRLAFSYVVGGKPGPVRNDVGKGLVQQLPHYGTTVWRRLSSTLSAWRSWLAMPPPQSHSCRRKVGGAAIEFPRYCPHGGADLAQAPIMKGKIRCPWHDVGFNVDTGVADCPGVSALAVKQADGPAGIPLPAKTLSLISNRDRM